MGLFKNIIFLSFLIIFFFGCNTPTQKLTAGNTKDNSYESRAQQKENIMDKVKYQLHIRKGVRIFGDSENTDSTKAKIIELTNGKTKTELYIDVAVYLDNDLLIKEDVLTTESGFVPFEITKGKHTLHVISKKGVSRLSKEFDISKSLWIDIKYDYYVSDRHPNAHKQGFHIQIRDYPTYYR